MPVLDPVCYQRQRQSNFVIKVMILLHVRRGVCVGLRIHVGHLLRKIVGVADVEIELTIGLHPP